LARLCELVQAEINLPDDKRGDCGTNYTSKYHALWQ